MAPKKLPICSLPDGCIPDRTLKIKLLFQKAENI